ncbi:MAG: thiaminase II [Fusobacteriaceae bacterium]
MKLTKEMLKEVEEIWENYNKHPFLKELESGTLDLEKFKFYLIQDYFYLFEYVKIFAIGITKTSEEKSMQKLAKSIDGILNKELDIHRGYMKLLKIDEEILKNTKSSLDNISYVNYMQAVSLNGDLLDVFSAILSCAYSYLLIAEKIKKNNPLIVEHKIFGSWVKGYSTPDYRKGCEELLDLIDELGKDIDETKKNKLKEIFVNCSKFEYKFWEMSYNMEMN